MKESPGDFGSSQVERKAGEIEFTGSRHQPQRSDLVEKLTLPPADIDRGFPDESRNTSMYTVTQAAQILGLPVTWIYSRTGKKAIPHHKFGKYIRFTASDIAAILSSFSRGPKPEVVCGPAGVYAQPREFVLKRRME